MATIRAYTTIEQSRKLAEILPIESVDMYFDRYGDPYFINVSVTHERIKNDRYQHLIPCWSLTALLGVLPESYQLTSNKEGKVQLMLIHQLKKDYYDNPVDACYEMIIRLHDLNLL